MENIPLPEELFNQEPPKKDSDETKEPPKQNTNGDGGGQQDPDVPLPGELTGGQQGGQEPPKNDDDTPDIISFIKERGYINEDEEVRDPEEALSKVIETEIARIFEALPPELREVNKLIIEHGYDMNRAVEEVFGTATSQVAELNPEDEAQAEQIASAYFKERGFSDEEVSEMVGTLKDTGKLTTKAAIFKDFLIKNGGSKVEERRKRMEQLEKERAKKAEEFAKAFERQLKEKDAVRGIVLDKKDKEELPDYVSKPVVYYRGKRVTRFVADLQRAYEDPEKFIALAKFLRDGLRGKTLATTPKIDNKQYRNKVTRTEEKPSSMDLEKFLLGE